MSSYVIQVCGGDKAYLSPDDLEKNHNQTKEAAINQFREVRKMGGSEYSQEYEDKLLNEMEESYEQYIKHNDSKNLFNVARTPITLVTTILAMYILSGVFGLVGIYSLSNLANMLLGFTIFLLCTWSYVHYSGKWVNVGTGIDTGTEFIWVHVSKHTVLFHNDNNNHLGFYSAFYPQRRYHYPSQ